MITRITTLTSALLVAASAVAQTSLPPNMEKNGYGGSGAGYSTILGSEPNQRIQIVNGDLVGTGVATWNSISFRRPSLVAVATTVQNAAHSWSNLSIQIGNANFKSASTTFSTNFATPPTGVFKGAANFPALGAASTANPSWGNFGGAGTMEFAFTAPYVTTGALGTCVDMQFSGGTFTAADYTMDGIPNANGDSATEAVAYWYGTPGGCYAPGRASNGYILPDPISYGPNYKDTNGSSAYAGQIGISFIGIELPSNALCVTLLQTGGWRGKAQASPFQMCQGLSIKLNDPWVPLFFTSDANGDVDTSANPILVKYDYAYVNTRLWTQAFYDVPTSQAASGIDGSMAISTWIPVQAPATEHRVFYANGANAGNATGTEQTDNLPIVLFK